MYTFWLIFYRETIQDIYKNDFIIFQNLRTSSFAKQYRLSTLFGSNKCFHSLVMNLIKPFWHRHQCNQLHLAKKYKLKLWDLSHIFEKCALWKNEKRESVLQNLHMFRCLKYVNKASKCILMNLTSRLLQSYWFLLKS